jgi:DNA-binding MarR family transcriptional regulator
VHAATRATPAGTEDRGHAVYQLLSQVFIEMDDGDRRFFRALSQALLGDAEDYTLTVPHFWALVHLGDEDGRTMAELASLLICDKSNVTAIVDKLEERSWAERRRGKAGDRRFMRVVLTAAGRALREQVMEAHDEWVRRRFAGLHATELDRLATLLKLVQPGFRLDPSRVVAEVFPDSIPV